MILMRHLLRVIGSRIASSILIVLAILQILTLLDVTTDVLERKLGIAGIAKYAFLSLPSMFEQAAPIGALAGCLFAFAKLARENAVVALRATGMSTYRLVAMALPAAGIVVVLHLAVALFATPVFEQTLDRWWRSTTPVAEQKPLAPRTFRLGADIVAAELDSADGARLKNVVIYRRDGGGAVIQEVKAARATFTGAAWRLDNARFRSFGEAAASDGQASSITTWAGMLEPVDVLTLFTPSQAIRRDVSGRALEGGASVKPAAFYQMQNLRMWAAPFAALVMLILSAPSALANFRSGDGAMLVLTSMAAGLLFLVADGVLTALGESAAAPPLLAAFAAPAAFAAWGLTLLVYLEG